MSQIFLPKRLIVYVVASDDGLAPNTQGGFCSLTVCKPVVRRVAVPMQDWVVGMSTNKHGKTKLIYAMQVEEKIPLNDYFKDHRFQLKKPHVHNLQGDNFIYNNEAGLEWGAHSHKPEKMASNLKTPYSLIAQNFWYFGENAPTIPHSLYHSKLVLGPRRGHKVVENELDISIFHKWLIQTYKVGIHGQPRDLKRAFM